MDNPRPEFRPRGNDKATIPMDMLHIEPPEGTKMFQIGAISGEGKRVNISGVKEIAYGVIRTFEERPGDEAQYAEGTFIHYEPRLNQIHVARRGLTADEINRIGELTTNMDRTLMDIKFLPKVIGQTQGLISQLGSITAWDVDVDDAPTIDKGTEENVAELGAILTRMREQQKEKDEQYKKTVKELDSLGVTLFTSKSGSTRDGFVPIKPLIEQFNREETEKSSSTPSGNLST